MRRITIIVLVSVVVILLAFQGTGLVLGRASNPGSVTSPAPAAASTNATFPSLSISPDLNKLDKNAKILIMGAGFPPGKAVAIMLEADTPGMPGIRMVTDIRDELSPDPVANERGCWATVWNASTYVSKKLVSEGIFTISAANPDTYATIVTAPVAFVDTTKPADKLPEWGKLVK